ncbi:MAG: NeuD/PglB/VioB family sugar acetyltransferase [Bacteroidia bacterium]|nr:NeuD/PglB/VioB family sugar acetyltransferase [Bacteroidia bacterium]
MKKEVIIFGGGMGAIQAIEAIELMSRADPDFCTIIGLADDDPQRKGTKIAGYEVIGSLLEASQRPNTFFAWGLGNPTNPRLRLIISERLGIPDARFIAIIHPSVVVSRTARIDPGATVYANATIAPGAHIGCHSGVGIGSVVEHDCVLEAGSLLASGVLLAGHVTIAAGTFVGQGANIKGDVKIGAGCMVGMGAVVLNDVEDRDVVVGNPARVIKKMPAL